MGNGNCLKSTSDLQKEGRYEQCTSTHNRYQSSLSSHEDLFFLDEGGLTTAQLVYASGISTFHIVWFEQRTVGKMQSIQFSR